SYIEITSYGNWSTLSHAFFRSMCRSNGLNTDCVPRTCNFVSRQKGGKVILPFAINLELGRLVCVLENKKADIGK
ncbi:MAG: hypothetical protein ACRD8Z_16305, partial [Nitrososphaeraceae archaeon]